jgi:hypothetical protein
MSEERFEQEEGEDVEAHKRSKAATDEGTDKSDDVEAHKHVKAMNQEPASDDESDDVEAHMRRAAKHTAN